MTTSTLHEILKREVDLLPDALAEEVLDFIMFVKEQRLEGTFLWRQVQETQAYRKQNPEDVSVVTTDQWDEATRHLE